MRASKIPGIQLGLKLEFWTLQRTKVGEFYETVFGVLYVSLVFSEMLWKFLLEHLLPFIHMNFAFILTSKFQVLMNASILEKLFTQEFNNVTVFKISIEIYRQKSILANSGKKSIFWKKRQKTLRMQFFFETEKILILAWNFKWFSEILSY